MKIEVADTNLQVAEETNWSARCRKYGFLASDFGREFLHNGAMWKICGLRSTKRSYPILAKSGGTSIAFRPEYVKKALDPTKQESKQAVKTEVKNPIKTEPTVKKEIKPIKREPPVKTEIIKKEIPNLLRKCRDCPRVMKMGSRIDACTMEDIMGNGNEQMYWTAQPDVYQCQACFTKQAENVRMIRQVNCVKCDRFLGKEAAGRQGDDIWRDMSNGVLFKKETDGSHSIYRCVSCK